MLSGYNQTDMVQILIQPCLSGPNDHEERLDNAILCIAKTGSHPVKPKVVAFMEKIVCEKYPKAVWSYMTKEQQIQVRKQQEQQGIKPIPKQTSIEARIAALEAQLGVSSQPKEGDFKKKEGETPKEPAWVGTEGILQ